MTTTHPVASDNGLNLDHLEALARAATPGPWHNQSITDDECQTVGLSVHAEAAKYPLIDEDHGPGMKDAEFIATANPAAVLALIALARRAQPEGEAPQANQMVRIFPDEVISTASEVAWCICLPDGRVELSGIFTDFDEATGYLTERAISGCSLRGLKFASAPAPAATLSPLCGAQHAESGKEVADKGVHGLLETLLRPYGIFDVAIVNAHAENQRDFFALKDRARAALAAQQAAAPGARAGEAMSLALSALEVATTPLPKDRQTVLTAQVALRAALSSTSAPGTPEAPITSYEVRNPRTGKSRYVSKSKKHLAEHWTQSGYEVYGLVRAAQLDGGQEGSESNG